MEFSTNTDTESLGEFLAILAGRIEGFGDAEIGQVLERVRALEQDATMEMSLDVSFRGKTERLRIEVFMDDIDAPDVYFFGSRSLIRAIEREWEQFV